MLAKCLAHVSDAHREANRWKALERRAIHTVSETSLGIIVSPLRKGYEALTGYLRHNGAGVSLIALLESLSCNPLDDCAS